MGARLRVYRRRIRAISGIRKTTKAMELVATSRIAKAQQRVEASQPYAREITRVLTALASNSNTDHPLLVERPNSRRAAVLVVTSDRGLAGAYNANVLRRSEELMRALRDEGKEPRLYVAGKKGLGYFRFRERRVEQSWQGFSERPRYEEAKQIADTLIEAFLEREVDEIYGVYTDFVSPLTQRAEARQFIPMIVEEVEIEEEGPYPLYLFEPNASEILDVLLPRYVETRVFAALLEAAASEHAARQRAMKAATDNAEDLIKSLTRVANQARQAEITTEIMEIVGGAEALTQAAETSERVGVS
jgi:F-type H+-transporting ATPase subunit gamma